VAFEAYRAQSQARPRRGRVMIVASIAFHAVLLTAGVAYSFWHVDELTPPSVKVTFLSAAPPPPPPPPPAGGGGGARKKVVVKPKTPTRVAELVQPRDTPEETPKEKPAPSDGPGERGGVKGGVIGGTIGGTTGGTIGGQIGGVKGGVIGGTVGGTGTHKPDFEAPAFGWQRKLSGDDPRLPAYLASRGAGVYHVLLQICVSASGGVDGAKVLHGDDPGLGQAVSEKVKTWRFRQKLTGAGTPVPFCFVWNFEFRNE